VRYALARAPPRPAIVAPRHHRGEITAGKQRRGDGGAPPAKLKERRERRRRRTGRRCVGPPRVQRRWGGGMAPGWRLGPSIRRPWSHLCTPSTGPPLICRPGASRRRGRSIRLRRVRRRGRWAAANGSTSRPTAAHRTEQGRGGAAPRIADSPTQEAGAGRSAAGRAAVAGSRRRREEVHGLGLVGEWRGKGERMGGR
jgi:hypothetical protein